MKPEKKPWDGVRKQDRVLSDQCVINPTVEQGVEGYRVTGKSFMGRRLPRGGRFVVRHDPTRMAQERAEFESIFAQGEDVFRQWCNT